MRSGRQTTCDCERDIVFPLRGKAAIGIPCIWGIWPFVSGTAVVQDAVAVEIAVALRRVGVGTSAIAFSALMS